MARSSQFLLLLWKNYLLQKRRILVTVFEIGIPTFLTIILILIRQRVVSEDVPNPTEWQSFDVDKLPSNPFPFGKWQLGFTPSDPEVQSLMERVGSRLNCDVQGYGTEELMVSRLNNISTGLNYLSGIVFSSGVASLGDSNSIRYTIRMKSYRQSTGTLNLVTNNWYTEYNFPGFQRVGPRERGRTYGGSPGYMREGFLPLQHVIDSELIRHKNPNATLEEDLDIQLRRFPYPPYINDAFVLVLQQQFPFIIMLSFIFTALQVVKEVVHEKEKKLKESMKMMGLNGWLHWVAWFTKYLIFLLISVLLMTFFFCIRVGNGAVVANTDPSLLFVFLLLYSVTTIMYCFMISTFFSKANSGAAAAGIIFYSTYIPYMPISMNYDTLNLAQKVGPMIFHNIAMAYGGRVIGMYEGIGSGLQWRYFFTPVSVDDSLTMAHIFLMLIVDAVLYGLVTWYVEGVFPGEYGIPQPWYFPFTRSYWCGAKQLNAVGDDDEEIMGGGYGQNSEYFEKEPMRLNPGIKIRNLRKEFGQKTAVAGMTLNMYEGQITALLGHNGAGKTTTMSMLTGFIPPTSGTAFVNGFDIRKDISRVRSSLGLCPQHDVLFDLLTVEEHLTFFAKLKGYPSEKVQGEIDYILKCVGLEPKRHAQTRTLSGGMKRKLSVGIALIGDSKVVILDEPTSGMDPDARRATWDILQKNREGRTMVLTTHFMDEADLLGDRIAIMAEGVVQCAGSSLYLKNKYGVGYHMVIVKDQSCDVNMVTEVVKRHVPEAEMESNISAELAYILPHESSPQFEALFTELEDNRSKLGISSFGASVTTMEEVFLKVGENANEGKFSDRMKSDPAVPTSAAEPPPDYDADNGINVIYANGSGKHSPDNTDLNGKLGNGYTANGTANQGRVNYGATHDYDTCISKNESQIQLCSLDNQRSSNKVFSIQVQRNTGIDLYFQQFYAMFLKRVLHTARNLLVTVTQMLVPVLFTVIALTILRLLPKLGDSAPLVLSLNKFSEQIVAYTGGQGPTSLTAGLASVYGKGVAGIAQQAINIDKAGNISMQEYLIQQGTSDLTEYNRRQMIAATFDSTNASRINRTAKAIGHFNNQAYHTPAITLTVLDNALLNYYTNSTNMDIQTTNHPLPRTVTEQINDSFAGALIGFTISICVMFGTSFLVSTFVVFIIKERSVKSKHIQFASGVHTINFWLSTFCWDIFNYLIPCLLLLIVFAGFDVKAYIAETNAGYVVLIFLLYGWAILPMMYLLSFMFEVPSSGFVAMVIWNILSGTATVLAVIILKIPALESVDVANVLEWVFLILLPNYALGQSLIDFYANYDAKSICLNPDWNLDELCPLLPVNATNPCCRNKCGNNCAVWEDNYLSWNVPGIGRYMIFMAVQGLVFSALIFLIESDVLKSFWYSAMSYGTKPADQSESHVSIVERQTSQSHIQEDDDVVKERERVLNTSISDLMQTDSLILKDLRKSYGSFVAVENTCVGIPQAETFGLLGVNGAGKTTTFKMMTGDETITRGNAYVNGFGVRTNIKEVQQRLGYCPQFDALIDQMTVTETLFMYARLRGVVENQIPTIAKDIMDTLLLQDHANKLAKDLSGGNKRKLSTGIALIGDPPIVFLDEPTTGMDPVARRLLWDTLSKVRESGRTLVLTSHSMEECEALCTRIAIMVNGVFKCLGSPQHLKNKFGEGYTLMAKVGHTESHSDSTAEALMNFIEGRFPGSVLKDEHQGYVHYQILGSDELTWARIFGIMERAKKDYNIEDYSVSQTTLDQVFINFARAQVPPRETDVGTCNKCGMLCKFCFCCGCCTDAHRE
ncbi:unnamed protein product [Owenia fusiformis]|uniref:Uncharacterized protein n=1 Tax=Owenia fusiformis TaxID=6347 RepID=A0A8J1TFB9_OWEFU|nr:unnamed protein product [Owenia fusiformis]